MAIKLKQGDEFALPVRMTLNGAALPVEDVECVEFRLGPVRKLWPREGEYDGETGQFTVRFTQEDTLSLPEDDAVQFDVRVKFRGGTVIGTQKMTVLVTVDALSEEII